MSRLFVLVCWLGFIGTSGTACVPKLPDCLSRYQSKPIYGGAGIFVGEQHEFSGVYRAGGPTDNRTVMANELNMVKAACRYPWGAMSYFTWDRAWCLRLDEVFAMPPADVKYKGYFIFREEGYLYQGVDVNGKCVWYGPKAERDAQP